MKQKGVINPIILITIIAFAAAFGAVWYFNKQSNSITPQPASFISAPADFNLTVEYGLGSEMLDTFEGTYTKDMVTDPSITIKMLLSDEEKSKIYQKMLGINFFDYPGILKVPYPTVTDNNSIAAQMYDGGYNLRVTASAKVKKVSWDGCGRGEDEKVAKFSVSRRN